MQNGASMKEVREKVAAHDFSAAGSARLVGSVPGRFVGQDQMKLWGHRRLRAALEAAQVRAAPDAQVICQFSSIGSVKPAWVDGEFAASLCVGHARAPRLQFVYPTQQNVRESIGGYGCGDSLPHSRKYEEQHQFLRQRAHQWVASWCGRSRFSPHIKSYLSLSPSTRKVDWMLLTSANLSKAAWGETEKNGTQTHIRSYELGVLLLPPSSSNKEVNRRGLSEIKFDFFCEVGMKCERDVM